MRRRTFLGHLAPVFALLLLAAACSRDLEPSPFVGAYRFDDGRVITIAHSDEDTFRFRDLESGRSQRLYPSDDEGLSFHSGPGWASDAPVNLRVRFRKEGARAARLEWTDVGGVAKSAERVPLREEAATFRSGDIELFGKLVLPQGEGPFPAVVLVHGSGDEAATLYYHEPYHFAAYGIAAFVFDKRGTGRSEGGGFLKYPHALVKAYIKRKLPTKDSWFHDSRPLLAKLDVPMLWLLGGQDLEAPNEATIVELQRLQQQGKPIELKIFPNADHGILEFEVKDGERIYTRYAPGYFQAQREWLLRQTGLRAR